VGSSEQVHPRKEITIQGRGPGPGPGQAKEAELFQQIGKLQMELEWLKKISDALTPMNDESWSIQTTGSSRLAAKVSCLDWPDPPTTTNQFLSLIPRWRSCQD
jgi:hypothetical protein